MHHANGKNSSLFFLMSLVFLCFILVLWWMSTNTPSSPMHVNLDRAESYFREGFDVDDLLTPRFTDSNWTKLPDGCHSPFKAGLLAGYAQPWYQLRDDPARSFTYAVKFDISEFQLVYMRENAVIPALYLPRLMDNWEIYLNGKVIARAMNLDENGDIEIHNGRSRSYIPFDDAFVRREGNLLVFRIISAPGYPDLGLSINDGLYIDDFSVIDRQSSEEIMLIFIGVYLFMVFYSLMIYLRNSADKYYLYFSMLAFWLAVYTAANSSLLQTMIRDSIVVWKLEYIFFTTMGIPTTLFIKSIIGKEYNLVDILLFGCALIVCVLHAFSGYVAMYRLLRVSMAILITTFVYAILTLYVHVAQIILHRHKNRGMPLLRAMISVISNTLSGNMILGITIAGLAMILGVFSVVAGGEVSQGVLLALFSVVISASFALNDDVTKTKLAAASQNAHLEDIVAKRTQELAYQAAVANAANVSKTRFLATVSHEIRTPMNAILGITEIQMIRDGHDRETRNALRQIYSSGHSLLGIINDILDLSKIETGRMELNPVIYDMASLINDTVELNITRIGSRQISFVLDIEESLPARLRGDELRLKQIMNNLLSNAFKYTGEGQVKLCIRHEDVAGELRLRLIVSDTGQGMRKEDLDKLFTEYSRFNSKANRTTEGTGLGMSITRQLVTLMNGGIKAESEFGKGSTFTVVVVQERVDSEEIGAETMQKLCSFTFSQERHNVQLSINRESMPYGRVLIVDDVETNLYVASGLMLPYDLEIDAVTSGFAALELIEAGAVYDVIFLDHMMPLLDGVETAQKMRALGYEGTIVALSANAIAGSDAMFKENGFDDFLSKPIDIRLLDSMLLRYIRDARKGGEECEMRVSSSEPGFADMQAALFEVFCRDARRAIPVLKEAPQKGDWKLYTTFAHAMKSALANVGESGELAASLEQAGRNGDYGYIYRNNERLIACLEALVQSQPATEPETDADIIEDDDLLREQLTLVACACAEYDDRAAAEALDCLLAMSWRPDTKRRLIEMKEELFLHSDFELVGKTASEFIE